MVARFYYWLSSILKRLFYFIFSRKEISKNNSSIKPTFQGSFIQYWYVQDWSMDRWEREFAMLEGIGITEVILQTTADTRTKYAAYFSDIPGFTHGNTDMVERALTAADKLGMKVRIGLGFSNEWWTRFFCQSWLDEEA